MIPTGNFWEDADVIYAYSRAQAIEDGALVDVSEMAREAGFAYPVAVTAAVWSTIEHIPPALKGIQDVEGRLWDVLWMARCAAKRMGAGTDTVLFQLYMDRNEGGRRVRLLTLKAVCGPGDDGEPVVTIMYPEED
jgi:hypothetical protein